MLSKGERKNKLKEVDMGIVKQLIQWREEQNNILDGTGFSCNLHPKTAEPCISCIYRKKCIHYEWERDYIYKHKEVTVSVRIRQKRAGRNKQKVRVIEAHFDNEPIYPCEPFDFACPEKDNCEEGLNCPWRE